MTPEKLNIQYYLLVVPMLCVRCDRDPAYFDTTYFFVFVEHLSC